MDSLILTLPTVSISSVVSLNHWIVGRSEPEAVQLRMAFSPSSNSTDGGSV